MLDTEIPRPPGWRFGPRRRWRLPSDLNALAQLAPPELDSIDVGSMRPSAVLVTIAASAAGPQVLLTKRSSAMRHHAGEFSFPGGRIDPGETPSEAAVREAGEEVGLRPDQIRVVGQLHHHRTVVSNSHIVPIVAVAPADADLVLNPAEVDRAFWVPLQTLIDRHHCEVWQRSGELFVVHFFALTDAAGSAATTGEGPEMVWGATARLLVELCDALVG